MLQTVFGRKRKIQEEGRKWMGKESKAKSKKDVLVDTTKRKDEGYGKMLQTVFGRKREIQEEGRKWVHEESGRQSVKNVVE